MARGRHQQESYKLNRHKMYGVFDRDKAQRAMSKRAGATVVEVNGSHSVYVSQPQAVAALIAKAANGVAAATRQSSRSSSDTMEVTSD
jgi:hypothetical protein